MARRLEFYGDNLVLIAENEADLQCMLDVLISWYKNNKIKVNEEKSKVSHFRTPSVQKTSFGFKCGDHTLEITLQYNY